MLKKVMKRLKKEEKGFTLIELLAVIVILAVIAVIAVPLIGKIIDNTKKDSDVATARQVYDAARLYVTGENNGSFGTNGITVTFAQLVSKGYIAGDTVLPSTKDDIDQDAAKSFVTFDKDGKLTAIELNDKSITVAEVQDGKAAR
ncbi:type II secretion system protein [Paenibacillus lupini]|uniref:competence type IV pilus major pilin ComGC n=1 Tax=Paenibacillus lupini TaxID=1450204 RepID=UPI00141F6BBF|nr:type II secretion system protein [Paenibacillus lupini]NIK24707.1 type IV pilus assembly protein PilA [Paenibacillus lupini]